MVKNVRPYSANLYKFNVFFSVDKFKITKGEIKQYVVKCQNNISNARFQTNNTVAVVQSHVRLPISSFIE